MTKHLWNCDTSWRCVQALAVILTILLLPGSEAQKEVSEGQSMGTFVLRNREGTRDRQGASRQTEGAAKKPDSRKPEHVM
ncbi:AGAP002781-PA-like protein [Anopheles sinensis]|uniref:AGAP002781-PA-like protein n=1 Tax=Anopheles sinensis TaxID=74873 RepID=A0A084VJV6_ANOSI|nr:AGAP002781-PA-like protein [Anopheles sinensis]